MPVGKEAAERWGCRDCRDPKCHPDMCVTAAPVFDWDVPESFDEVGVGRGGLNAFERDELGFDSLG